MELDVVRDEVVVLLRDKKEIRAGLPNRPGKIQEGLGALGPFLLPHFPGERP